MSDRSAPTAATRLAPRPAPTTQRPARQLEPRPGRPAAPARQPRGGPAPAYAQRRRGGRAARRMIALLAIVALFAAAVAVAVAISTSTSSSVVHLRTVVGHDAQSAIDQVRSVINKYTK